FCDHVTWRDVPMVGGDRCVTDRVADDDGLAYLKDALVVQMIAVLERRHGDVKLGCDRPERFAGHDLMDEWGGEGPLGRRDEQCRCDRGRITDYLRTQELLFQRLRG